MEKIKKKYSIVDFNENNWFEFKDDPTMRQIEKIFNGSYIGNIKQLNGVVQVFNLFNIREKDINKAKQLASKSNSIHLYPNESEVINLFENKPVYLAWGGEFVNINRSFADNIFEYVKNSNFMYLKNDMIDNCFYHPGYINFSSSKDTTRDTLNFFLKYYEI